MTAQVKKGGWGVWSGNETRGALLWVKKHQTAKKMAKQGTTNGSKWMFRNLETSNIWKGCADGEILD